MGPKNQNTKVLAAKEKQAGNKSKKDAEEARRQEDADSKDWSKGSDIRSKKKADLNASKADEAAEKRKQKADLQAAEEEEMSGITTKVKKAPTLSKKKGKKKNDFSALEDALVSSADKKVKAKKRAEKLKKEEEEKKKKSQASVEGAAVDPLMANTDAMLGNGNAGRKSNLALDDGVSGIDGALGVLGVGSKGEDTHPEKRMKALHKAFEERMMPEMKQDYPGLRQSQYKEKIFTLWKKSPENPLNMKFDK